MEARIVSQDGQKCRMTLRGEITQRNLRNLDDPLDTQDRKQYCQHILCNMADTTMLDSAGVSWLLINHKRCRDQGVRFVLCSIPKPVMNVILVLRLNLVFDITENESTAEKLFEIPIDEPLRGSVTYNPDIVADKKDQPSTKDAQS